MADEISYEVLQASADNLVVKYSLGGSSIDLTIPWDSDDVVTVIARYAPRAMLENIGKSRDLASVIGFSGTIAPPEPPEAGQKNADTTGVPALAETAI
jgi:hypothetical protein